MTNPNNQKFEDYDDFIAESWEECQRLAPKDSTWLLFYSKWFERENVSLALKRLNQRASEKNKGQRHGR